VRKLLKILAVCFLVSTQNLHAQKAMHSYSSSSVLSSGEWFRIAITTDGIYRIDYSRLKQLGLTYPSNPRIYGNNSGQLSYYNDNSETDDLKELPIYTFTGNDGILNEGDYILFFGRGTHRWNYDEKSGKFDFLRHNYSDTAFYFITSAPTTGKRVTAGTEPSLPANYNSSESDALYIHELETENLIRSGREWFEPISTSKGISINPDFKDLVLSEKIKCTIRAVARASVPTQFRLYEGESVRKSLQVSPVNLYDFTGIFAEITDSAGTFQSTSASPVFEIRFYNNGEAGAKGWIDYVKLQGRRSNSFTGSLMLFRDSRSIGSGRITGFTIKSQINDVSVWDVSDPYNSKQILFSRAGDNIYFKTKNDSLKTFIAFTPANSLIPSIKPTPLPHQNLHGSEPADMIIITHPVFRAYAAKLADIHLKNSGLVSQVVTVEQVYNEFSGGIPDIVAIRNFLRMKYIKQAGTSHPLKYLLLFGDGSYENKTLPPDNPNFVPTYQSQNSNVITASFASDDFYGLLDDGEGEADGTEDIGIGRLPVSDTVQAGIMLFKIKEYLNPVNNGDWKNIICLTADDEDGNIHVSDAEGLASVLKDSVPVYNIDKIYLDAFRQVTTVNGQSYPEANKAINDRINSGCLIFNYTGHGSETGLAHERVVKTEDINAWKNGGKLPLFITATCEFSRFDDIETNVVTHLMTGKTSAGEMVLLNKNGGAIALMSTTRVVFSAPNYFLNKSIFNYAFSRDESGNSLRLGEIIRIAKNNSGGGPNKRNFTLLGDPALKLAFPWYGKIMTDSINKVSVKNKIDSLKALSLVTVSGHIEDNQGTLKKSFSGVVSPLVYDKENIIKTLANDGGQIIEFNLRNNVLFSGNTTAKEGRFRFTFIVPRDINYSFGTGKISYYAHDNKEDMNGCFNNVIVGGFANTTITDTSGPEIKLYMNDTLFKNGGITDQNPRLLAIIEDKGGINTTGSGIGHDITGYVDKDINRSVVLNNYYVNDPDNYKRGKIFYNLSGLSVGNHSLTLKAWDNFNNSTEESILFVVDSGDKFVLKNLLNYPNPFFRETSITADHNRPDNEFDVIIDVFNLSGRIIRVIKTKVSSAGYVLPPVVWDGNDSGGNRVGKGIYPYTVKVSTSTGESAMASGRMIIL
jgi:hypothetical protein